MKKLKCLPFVLAAALAAGCAGPAQNPADATAAPEQTQAAPAAEPEEAVGKGYQGAYDYLASLPEDKHGITAEELLQKLRAGDTDGLYIVDTRTPELYEAGHIKGAVNISYDDQLPLYLDRMPDDKCIVTICIGGGNDSMATAMLTIAGKNSRYLAGGMVGQGGFEKLPGSEEFLTTEEALPLEEEHPIDPEIKEALLHVLVDEMQSVQGVMSGFYMVNAQLVELLGNEDYVLIDLRAPEQYEAGHIEGSVNAPFESGLQETILSYPRDKTLVFISDSGQYSAHCVPLARLMGYEAFTLFFGVGSEDPSTSEPGSWVQEGYPLVK